jgi:hypothetical protein
VIRMRMATTTALVVLGAHATGAQDPKAAVQEKVAAIKEAMAKNQASLRQYSWTAHTEVSVKGEVKNQKDELCHYGPDGKVVKTPLSAPPPARQARGMKGKIIEKKKEEMKDYMERAGTLIAHYVPPSSEKMQESLQTGKASLSEADSGFAVLVFKDYYKPGDALTLKFDRAAKKLSKINVDSFLDDASDKVLLDVTFEALPDGTNCVGRTHLRADAKQIDVNVQNVDYKKAGS